MLSYMRQVQISRENELGGSWFNVVEGKGEYDLVLFLSSVFFSQKCAAVFRATESGRQKNGNDDGDD